MVKVEKPDDLNIIIGQAHFIKTVEDLYEVMISSVPNIKFAVAFCEASGDTLVRAEGNDDYLKKIACDNALRVAAGHSFFIAIKNAYPINILNSIKMVPEVCRIFCATANRLEVIVAKTGQGRAIIGVVDGASPRGVENEREATWRKQFLRKIGYKIAS
ncbi:MAG: adenosine-specific kinase [Candidatus Omnitrophota bacterium]